MVYWLAGFVCLYKATTEIYFNSSEYSFLKGQTLMCIIYWLVVLTPSSMHKKTNKQTKTLAPYMQVLLVFNA